MIGKYYYSASTKGFYLDSVHEYIPEDSIEIDADTYASLLLGQESGQVIEPGNDGKPKLADPPALTQAESLILSESKKANLMAEATVAINPLQDAVDLGEATSKEEVLLKSWKQYRVTLNRMDLSTAPDIKWPDKPQ